MAYEKLPGVPGKSKGCICCGLNHETLDMARWLAVGFGDVNVKADDKFLYSENDWPKDKDYPTAQLAEDMALQDKDDRDWRINFFAPLYEAEYQRQGPGHWVLVRTGDGFA